MGSTLSNTIDGSNKIRNENWPLGLAKNVAGEFEIPSVKDGVKKLIDVVLWENKEKDLETASIDASF